MSGKNSDCKYKHNFTHIHSLGVMAVGETSAKNQFLLSADPGHMQQAL